MICPSERIRPKSFLFGKISDSLAVIRFVGYYLRIVNASIGIFSSYNELAPCPFLSFPSSL